jgi:hypothetical protein
MELAIQSGPDAGKIYQVGPAPLVAGRQPGSDIVLNDGQASRRHVQFELSNNTLLARDLGSSNGTLVNGQRLLPNQPRPLAPGDLIQIGNTIVVVRSTQNPAAPGPRPYQTIPTPNPFGPTNAAQPAFNQPVQPAPIAAQPYPIAGYPPARPTYPTPQKKGNGLLIGGIIGIVALAAIAISAILIIGNRSPDNTPVAIFNPPIQPAQQGGTATPLPVTTPPVGLSGANPLPPAPRGISTATRPPATTVATTGDSKSVAALGMSISFPRTWQTEVDEDQNSILSSAPDGVTLALIQRRTGVTGSATDRLTAYITSARSNLIDLKIIRDIKPNATNSALADAYITYNTKDQSLRRAYVLAAATGEDTYFMQFTSENQKFDSQTETFTAILKSIQI